MVTLKAFGWVKFSRYCILGQFQTRSERHAILRSASSCKKREGQDRVVSELFGLEAMLFSITLHCYNQ